MNKLTHDDYPISALRADTPNNISDERLREILESRYCCPDCKGNIETKLYFRDDRYRYVDFEWRCRSKDGGKWSRKAVWVEEGSVTRRNIMVEPEKKKPLTWLPPVVTSGKAPRPAKVAESKFADVCRHMIETKKCHGDCCGPTPMPPDYIVKFKDQLCAEIQLTHVANMGDQVWHVHQTEDMFCVFLNRDTRLCSIYEDRTWICKAYGESADPKLWCSRIAPDGTKRTRSDRRRVLRMTKRFVRKVVKKAKEV